MFSGGFLGGVTSQVVRSSSSPFKLHLFARQTEKMWGTAPLFGSAFEDDFHFPSW